MAYFVDALRNEQFETDYWRFYANGRDGQAAVLTYSFMKTVPAGTVAYYGNPNFGFEGYTAAEKTLVRKALAEFEAIADIRFKEKNGSDTDLQFGQFDIMEGTAGYAHYPLYNKVEKEIHRGPNYGGIWVDTAYMQTHVLLHEIGHALGLEHPFEGMLRLPGSEDLTGNTVMSYTGAWGTRLALYDKIALQSIYGPARKRLGDDTYTFGKDKLIWDGGGTDEVTAARARTSVTIDLNDGSWNHVGPKAASFLDNHQGNQVYIGNFTMIENVTGSDHNDMLIGNERINRIAGRNGDDTIQGGRGADKLIGGRGADEFVLVHVRDSTVAKSGRDSVIDFRHGHDDGINLVAIDADANAAGDQAFTFIGRGAFSGTAGELRYRGSGNNILVMGDVNGDRQADFAFLLLGRIELQAPDFTL